MKTNFFQNLFIDDDLPEGFVWVEKEARDFVNPCSDPRALINLGGATLIINQWIGCKALPAEILGWIQVVLYPETDKAENYYRRLAKLRENPSYLEGVGNSALIDEHNKGEWQSAYVLFQREKVVVTIRGEFHQPVFQREKLSRRDFLQIIVNLDGRIRDHIISAC